MINLIKYQTKNNLKSNFIFIYLRFIAKIHQLFFFNENTLNKEFNFKFNPYYQKIGKFDFKIIKSLRNLNFKKFYFVSLKSRIFRKFCKK